MPHTDLLNVQYSLSVSTNSQTEVVVSSSQENASAISFEFIGRGEPWNKANFLFFSSVGMVDTVLLRIHMVQHLELLPNITTRLCEHL